MPMSDCETTLRAPVKLKKRIGAEHRLLRSIEDAIVFFDTAYPAIEIDDRAYALLCRLKAAQRSGMRQDIEDVSLDLQRFLKDRRLT
jgi:hypothetical protein